MTAGPSEEGRARGVCVSFFGVSNETVHCAFFDKAYGFGQREVRDVAFQDQMAIRGLNGQDFSDAGDSGSAILERATNKVVGLLFAGATNGSITFANHIADVLAQLKIKLP